MTAFAIVARMLVARMLVAVGLLTAPAAATASDDTPMLGRIDRAHLSIGTGGITGVYYPAGGALCAAINQARPTHGVRCSVQPSAGSVANIEHVRSGRAQLAIVQSDIHDSAVRGIGPFKERGPFAKLRSVFSLYTESLTVVVNQASGVRSFEELKGKRVNVGPVGSGGRATLGALMSKYGWTYDQFAEATDLPQATLAQALCSRKIDAVVFLAGHPNSVIQDITSTCPASIVPIASAKTEELLADNRYYGNAVIPGGIYPNNAGDVKTFGVLATLVASEDVSPEVIYVAVREIFEQMSGIRRMHMALSRMDKASMVHAGLTAPLHEGAVRYYREAGLLPSN